MISASQLLEMTPLLFHWLKGPRDQKAAQIVPPRDSQAGSIVFVSQQQDWASVCQTPPSILVLDEKTRVDTAQVPDSVCILQSTRFREALAFVLDLLNPQKQLFSPGIHPTAVIHPTARVGQNCRIGPHVVIEPRARIGDHCILHPNVVVGWDCEVGSHCEIFANTTIGSDGFGYAPDAKGLLVKVPQIGRVVIEDHCDIGANCAIDRATMGETRIRRGAKLDNLCHIGHNCDIGENSALAAGFMTAGSSKIGKNFMCGGDVVVSDHIEITDNVIVGGRSAVINDVKEPGRYTGYPLQPWREGLRTLSSLPSVPELRKQVQQIIEKISNEDP